MRDTENKAKENSVRGLELTAEKINSYSAAEGTKETKYSCNGGK